MVNIFAIVINIFAIVINIFGRDANTIYITIFVEGEKLWNLIKIFII